MRNLELFVSGSCEHWICDIGFCIKGISQQINASLWCQQPEIGVFGFLVFLQEYDATSFRWESKMSSFSHAVFFYFFTFWFIINYLHSA